MEKLKPREEVFLPDVRYLNRVNLDHSTGIVSEMTIDTIYQEVEQIQLNPTVSESVRSHFEVARNLAIYSWFVYSFNVVAAMQAFASLEMAVKEKTGDTRTNLKSQLDNVFKGRQLVTGVAPAVDLSRAISWLRNDLAHGSTTLHGQGLILIRTCADLINELFPPVQVP
jgi:hypothetical protein